MSRAPLPLRDDERLIFALDVPGREDALAWVDRLGDAVSFYKIGMELLASGEYFEVLDALAARDKRVFVDLKFFDIPATAAAVIRRLSQWPVSYATIHGWHPAMMEACAGANSSDMRLLAVTVLTSMGRDDLRGMGIDREPVDVVVERALAAQAAGIDGVIAWARKPARSAPPPAPGSRSCARASAPVARLAMTRSAPWAWPRRSPTAPMPSWSVARSAWRPIRARLRGRSRTRSAPLVAD